MDILSQMWKQETQTKFWRSNLASRNQSLQRLGRWENNKKINLRGIGYRDECVIDLVQDTVHDGL
jgi:hypothetical protein